MQDALAGITTIWVVIGVGWLIAHLGLVNQTGRRFMAVLAFTVASPALLFGLLARASLDHVFSVTVVVSALAVACVMGLYLLGAAIAFRPRRLGPSVVGVMASGYTNAANFGLPVALALLADATWVAPILLMQVALIQPVALALLDGAGAQASGVRLSPLRYLSLPFRNPITVGIVAGLAVNLLRIPLPKLVLGPVDMVGGMAVPLMLLSFGVSLRLDPLPGAGPHRAEMAWAVALKVVAHPLAAWLIGRFAFGLTGLPLYAVVVLAALPAAQNVYVVATRYEESELLARDAVFWSTICSVATLLVIAALLGG